MTRKSLAAYVLIVVGMSDATVHASFGGDSGFGAGGPGPVIRSRQFRGSSGYRNGGYVALGRVDLAGDLNYDGFISGDEWEERTKLVLTPPGLVVGKAEMSKVVLRVVPGSGGYSNLNSGGPLGANFSKLSVSLSLRGFNLNDKNGRFGSLEAEQAQCGRVRVWADEKRSQLLLDSADPKRHRMEWPMSVAQAPSSVYVEGVVPAAPGAAFVLMLELGHSKKVGFFGRLFAAAPARDSFLLTCQNQPHQKYTLHKFQVQTSPSLSTNSFARSSNRGMDSYHIWLRIPAMNR